MFMAAHFYESPTDFMGGDFKANYSMAYTWGCHGVGVEVDTQTGQVEILRYIAAHEVDRALSFRDYKMLTAMDALPVEPIIVEDPDPAGPYGAKGIGEPGLVPTAPAIANAIYDAVGIRMAKLPIKSEEVLAAIFEKQGRAVE
jgi:CO/xanthine dehydrogenase Mo-binding subunit